MRKSLTFMVLFDSIPKSLNMNESACLLSTLEKQKMKKMKTFCVFYLLFFASSKVIYVCVCVSLSHERVDVCKTLPPQKQQYPGRWISKESKRMKKKERIVILSGTQGIYCLLFFSPLRIFVEKCENQTYHWICWRYFKIHVHSNRLSLCTVSLIGSNRNRLDHTRTKIR